MSLGMKHTKKKKEGALEMVVGTLSVYVCVFVYIVKKAGYSF